MKSILFALLLSMPFGAAADDLATCQWVCYGHTTEIKFVKSENHNEVEVHLRKIVTEDMLKKIEGINGITGAYTNFKYELKIYKGELFSWSELIPQIETILKGE